MHGQSYKFDAPKANSVDGLVASGAKKISDWPRDQGDGNVAIEYCLVLWTESTLLRLGCRRYPPRDRYRTIIAVVAVVLLQ